MRRRAGLKASSTVVNVGRLRVCTAAGCNSRLTMSCWQPEYIVSPVLRPILSWFKSARIRKASEIRVQERCPFLGLYQLKSKAHGRVPRVPGVGGVPC